MSRRARSVAVLADVHGNLPALEAVLEDLARRPVDRVLVGGDLVGRGPQGGAVVERIRERGWPAIRGNHEDYLLAFRRGEVPDEWLDTEEWSASRWMAAELGSEHEAWLAALPLTLAPDDLDDVALVHGSPRSYHEGLGPWTPGEELERHLEQIGRPVLLCAHTHRPMCRRVGNGLVVNVGAVGLPFNGDRCAQYAVLERRDEGWSVDARRVPYDVERTLDVYRSSGFLEAGGVTAQLLALELERARPFLVPFLRWALASDRPRVAAELGAFLARYDPDEPLELFLSRLTGR